MKFLSREARLILVLSLFLPAAAYAQDTPSQNAAAGESAPQLFLRGQALYQEGDYDAAIDLWGRAYALDPRPALQYNLAQAYGRLGRMVDEQHALQRFIAETRADDPVIGPARTRLAMLEQRIAQTGLLVSAEGFDGASVRIDGEGRGRLPRPDPFYVTPGQHTIEVTLAGHEPFRATLNVPAGEALEVHVELTPVPSAAVAQDAAREDAGPSLVLPIALYAAGGALIVTGAAMGGVALSKSGDHPVAGTDAADQVRTYSIVADVTLAVGLAAGVSGLLVHLLRKPSDDTSTVSLLPTVGPQYLGLEASGRF